MISLSEIKKDIDRLAYEINSPANLLPTYGSSRRDGTPHIELDDNYYYYIDYDRNTTVFNKRTSNFEELLYWVFCDVTFYMSSDYELKNRETGADSRMTIFNHQLKLLETLNPEWEERRRLEIDELLKNRPNE